MNAKVLFVAPVFGDLTDRCRDALVDHAAPGTVVSFTYKESDYERPAGVFASRILRLFSQILPLSNVARTRLETIVGKIRFQNKRLAQDVTAAARSNRCDQLLLVKPSYLSVQDLIELQSASGCSSTSIILWDALWRTPSIAKLFSDVDQVFTTEPDDANEKHSVRLLAVPKSAERFENIGDSSNRQRLHHSQSTKFFHCGAWSADRFLWAAKVARIVRSLDATSEIHLVSEQRFARVLNRRLGFGSRALSSMANLRGVQECDVLIDFGRIGQGSPSERLADARSAGVVLLSTNPLLRTIGAPVVVIGGRRPKDILLAALECVSLVRESKPADAWGNQKLQNDLEIDAEMWVTAILGVTTEAMVGAA
jgi:hypothetical protein